MREFMEHLVRGAGKRILASKRDITAYKGLDQSIVTMADHASNDFIMSEIKKKFPEHVIYSEESIPDISEIRTKEHVWIIDPLDGTLNFANEIPLFCISIAYVKNGDVQIGAVYDPNRDELFLAEKNKGAYRNGKSIRVQSRNTLRDAMVATWFPRDAHKFAETMRDVSRLADKGAHITSNFPAALVCSYVACGRLSLYFEKDIAPWDIAAGLLLIREAGGVVKTDTGGVFDVYDFPSMLAGSADLVAAFLAGRTV